MAESIADLLKRKFPDIGDETRGKILTGLDAAGIVEARLLKKVKRHHVKNYMTEFILEFVTHKGLFLTAEGSQWMVDAQKLMKEGILTHTDVEFEKIHVFEGVDWPSLNDIPGRIVTAIGRKLWFFGRTAFESLHKKFFEKLKGVMEFDGIVGGGKTYLQVMLACRCFYDFHFQGTNKRLVCLFEMPNLLDALLLQLKKALVLAFWDVPRVQRTVLAAENIDELKATVDELKATWELYFIFDEWNVLDDRAKDSGLQKIWETLSTMEMDCRSLHGGSARSDAAVTVNESYKGQYDLLSDAELNAFLLKENLPKHHLLLRYTGFLPLYVRVFLTCQKATQNDEELVASFLKTDEVNAIHVGFTRMVMDVGTGNRDVKLDLYARLLCQAATKDEFNIIGDQRWVLVTEDGHLCLFSEYARAAFMQRLEMKLGKDSMDGIIDTLALQIIDKCAQQVPNRSLIGWMVERIVVHIARRWAIGEPGLDDKVVKRVHYFDIMPKCSTEHLTACIPLDGFFPYADFVLRYEVVTRDGRGQARLNTDEKPRLHVNAYEVSLSLAKGDPHWDKPGNFLDPIFATKFIARFGMDEVDWVYTFIGLSKHKVADGRVDGKYLRQFVTFQELATSFGASLSYNIKAALQAVDKL